MVILTGAGDQAFCSGGDQSVRGDGGYVGEDGVPRLNVLDLQRQIRYLPKPVIAMVAGYAIGGGHVLHVVCDLTIAADNARLRPDRPAGRQLRRRLRRDAIWRASSATRRRARSGISAASTTPRRRSTWAWSTPSCRWRSWKTKRSQWAREILAHSPTALRFLKAAFNADTDGLAGLQQLAGDATLLFYMSEEGQEGRNAFEKAQARFLEVPAPAVTLLAPHSSRRAVPDWLTRRRALDGDAIALSPTLAPGPGASSTARSASAPRRSPALASNPASASRCWRATRPNSSSPSMRSCASARFSCRSTRD